MQTLTNHAAAVYRRVDLDARIEASEAGDLTRICLEEAVASLEQVLFALERDAGSTPRASLSRAHSIALYLAHSVSPNNPMRSALVQFYGGMAETIGRNLHELHPAEITQARDDFADLLGAF